MVPIFGFGGSNQFNCFNEQTSSIGFFGFAEGTSISHFWNKLCTLVLIVKSFDPERLFATELAQYTLNRYVPSVGSLAELIVITVGHDFSQC
jgi:hypothetical protein